MKKINKIVLISILLTIFTIECFAGSPGTYRKQIYKISDKIHNVLILNNYCTSKKDCRKKEYFFYEPLLKGMTLNFYTITSSKMIKQLTKIAKEEYEYNNKDIYIKLNFYEINHASTLGGSIFNIGGNTPFQSIEFLNKNSYLFKFYNFIGKEQ
jgi:hypothetical protein